MYKKNFCVSNPIFDQSRLREYVFSLTNIYAEHRLPPVKGMICCWILTYAGDLIILLEDCDVTIDVSVFWDPAGDAGDCWLTSQKLELKPRILSIHAFALVWSSPHPALVQAGCIGLGRIYLEVDADPSHVALTLSGCINTEVSFMTRHTVWPCVWSEI